MIGSPFTDAELADARRRADPVADAIVSDFVQSRGIVDPQYLVQRLIAEHRTLPEPEQIPSVRSYFQDPVPLPEWAEPELLREGQRFFRTFGVHIASSLFCASLPLSYTAVDGSVVLALTADLVSNTRRRLAQTGEMLLDVMGANDECDARPFGADTYAYRAAHGVRLFHAAVRHMLHEDDQFDESVRGEPINQEDLLGTLTVFTVTVIESLERFGVSVDERQRDAYVRLWLTAGFLLGIEPGLLSSRADGADAPLRWAELVALRDAIARRHAAPAESGRRLMDALLAEESGAMRFGLRGLPCACTRLLIGSEYSAFLGIPAADWTRFLLRPLPLINRVLFHRRYYDQSGWLFAKVTRSLYSKWIADAAADSTTVHPWRYEPIRRAWNIEPVAQRAQRVVRHPVAVTRRRRTLGTAYAAR